MAETDIETGEPRSRRANWSTEIERTRANLAQTIDEIADRVSPATSRGAPATAPRSGSARSTRSSAARSRSAAVSVTCYLVWRKLRK